MCKDFIKKHIFFSNDLSDDPVKAQKRKDLYTDMIARIISESLFFFQDDYYNADISTIEREMTHISYCIETFPVVNAMVDNQNNYIILNLFTMVAANNMTVITELLDLLSRPEKATTSQIMLFALKWLNFYENEYMISTYIREYGAKKQILPVVENGKMYAVCKGYNLSPTQKYSEYMYDVFKLIFLHELGHWQYARFKESWKMAYKKQAYNALKKQYANKSVPVNQKQLESWMQEIIADYIAVLVYTKTSRQYDDSKQCTKHCYIAIGLFYGLIAMEELAYERYKKGTEKHPPVYIRQNAVRELYAGFFSDILKIPYDVFMENEIQEWYVIESYFSQIIEEYWRKHYG